MWWLCSHPSAEFLCPHHPSPPMLCCWSLQPCPKLFPSPPCLQCWCRALTESRLKAPKCLNLLHLLPTNATFTPAPKLCLLCLHCSPLSSNNIGHEQSLLCRLHLGALQGAVGTICSPQPRHGAQCGDAPTVHLYEEGRAGWSQEAKHIPAPLCSTEQVGAGSPGGAGMIQGSAWGD